jgi:soluble lytic murein transglycosylase
MRRCAVLALGWVVACAEPSPSGAAPRGAKEPGRVPTLALSASTEPVDADAALGADGRWVEFVRSGDFREAARRIDLISADRAKDPEIRYVRARAAMEERDFVRARALLLHLDVELPLLAEDVKRAVAECALELGPFEDAAHYFSATTDPASWVKAGVAYQRATELDLSRDVLDRAIRALGSADDGKSVATRLAARALRAHVALAAHDVAGAATDLRWLAVEAPASDAGRTAEAELRALTPPSHLTSEQQLIRAKHLAEAGDADSALAAIDRASTDTVAPPAAPDLVRAKGYAYYSSRSDYGKAAALLDQSSKLDPKQAARDAFFSARALARAQDDPGAVLRYDALALRYPTSPFAEEARYQAARLRFLLGKWDAAATAYRGYIAAHTKPHAGRFTRPARYELALTLLASKHARDAVPLFDDLAKTEDDPLERASLHELEGVALADVGDRDRAVAAFTQVIHERPLSFPALSSAARLSALGAEVPPALQIGTSTDLLTPLHVSLPVKAALFQRLGLIEDAEADILRHEPELVARYAPRGYEALCEAYGAVGAGAERYRIGRSSVKGDALDHVPTDTTRWAWDCVYPTPFDGIVRAAEETRGLPYGLLHSVMRQESAFRPDAVSPANAIGLLQLVPSTASRVATELGMAATPELLLSPRYNVTLGAFYLQKVLATFGGNVALAAAAYNAGPRAVSKWLETGEDLPLDVWVARIPFAETRGYVLRVLGNMARYTYLHGGEGAVPALALELPKGVRAGVSDY